MKRTPLARRAPLRRGAPLQRGGQLRPRSISASAKARREAQEGPQWRLCHTLPCCACGHFEPGGIHGHHEISRARGGKDKHCLPLCWRCHNERHRVGARAFWRARGRDPDEILARLREQVAAQQPQQLAPVPGRA